MEYITKDQLLEKIKCATIKSWDSEKVILNNGIELSIVCSEQDCCASAGGAWNKAKMEGTKQGL